MKHLTFCACLAILLLAGFSAFAEVKDNPYQVIIDRNPFALRPIPPPPVPVSNEPTNPPTVSNIKLTGISTLLGPAKVFLQYENPQTKKTEFPPGMLVGEKQGEIEVLSIDPANGIVRIRHGDAETTLDFDHNGIKAPGTGGATAVPGGPPGLVPMNLPPAVPPPGGVTATPTANGSRAIVAGGSTAAPAAVPNAMFNGAAGLPSRQVRTDYGNNVLLAGGGQPVNNGQPANAAPAVPAMSRDEAEARIEAQRQLLLQKEAQGLVPKGMPSILPPTRMGQSLGLPGSIPPPPSPHAQ